MSASPLRRLLRVGVVQAGEAPFRPLINLSRLWGAPQEGTGIYIRGLQAGWGRLMTPEQPLPAMSLAA